MDDWGDFEWNDPYDAMPFGDLMRLRDKELDEDEAAGEFENTEDDDDAEV